jgi:hypothetical protein
MGMQQISGRMRAAPTQALRAFFAGIGRILLTADRPEARTPAAGESGSADGTQGTSSAGRWRDLDKTGNVRLLSAEEMAIEFGTHQAAGSTADTTASAAEVMNAAMPAADAPDAATPAADAPDAAMPAADARDAATPAADAPDAATPAADARDAAMPAADARDAAMPAADAPDAAGVDSGAVDITAGAPDASADAGAHDASAPASELPLTGYDQLSLPSIRARLRNLDAGQLRILAEYERAHAERADVLGMFERRIEKIEAGG